LVSIILFSVLPSTSASVIASVGPNGEEVNGDCYGISRVSFNGSYDQNSGMFSASVESCSDDNLAPEILLIIDENGVIIASQEGWNNFSIPIIANVKYKICPAYSSVINSSTALKCSIAFTHNGAQLSQCAEIPSVVSFDMYYSSSSDILNTQINNCLYPKIKSNLHYNSSFTIIDEIFTDQSLLEEWGFFLESEDIYGSQRYVQSTMFLDNSSQDDTAIHLLQPFNTSLSQQTNQSTWKGQWQKITFTQFHKKQNTQYAIYDSLWILTNSVVHNNPVSHPTSSNNASLLANSVVFKFSLELSSPNQDCTSISASSGFAIFNSQFYPYTNTYVNFNTIALSLIGNNLQTSNWSTYYSKINFDFDIYDAATSSCLSRNLIYVNHMLNSTLTNLIQNTSKSGSYYWQCSNPSNCKTYLPNYLLLGGGISPIYSIDNNLSTEIGYGYSKYQTTNSIFIEVFNINNNQLLFSKTYQLGNQKLIAVVY